MFTSRNTPSAAQIRWLYVKILLFVVGASLGLVGMTAGPEWLVTAAVVVLAAALILRMLTRDRHEDPEEE
jgi:hypothetical protein